MCISYLITNYTPVLELEEEEEGEGGRGGAIVQRHLEPLESSRDMTMFD